MGIPKGNPHRHGNSKDGEAIGRLYELKRGAGSEDTEGRKLICKKLKRDIWKNKVALLCR